MATRETVRTLVDLVREEEVPFKAASIAFYALASFIPLLIISLAILSFFGASDMLVEALQTNLSDSASQVLDNVLTGTQGRGVAGGIGVLFTLWSATKIFRGLIIAFAELYDRESDLSLPEQLKKSLIVLGMILFAFLALSATSVLLLYVPIQIPFAALVWNVLAIAFVAIGLLPLYYVLPPVSTTLRHAIPGSILTAVGWVVLQYGFSFYTQNAGGYAAYGVLGGVLLFVTLLYFAAIILLVGAALNIVLDRGVQFRAISG
jgi:membrane protein